MHVTEKPWTEGSVVRLPDRAPLFIIEGDWRKKKIDQHVYYLFVVSAMHYPNVAIFVYCDLCNFSILALGFRKKQAVRLCAVDFSYAVTALDLGMSDWLVSLCMHACPCDCLCVLATVWMRRRCRRSCWLLKVAFLRQARPFNQVPHIRQLCPHSKQPLRPAGELQHPAGGGRGQLALGD